MSLEFPDKEFFIAAVGYSELGLFLEANEQVEKINPLDRITPAVLALRIDIYRGLEKWDLMQAASEVLHELEPRELQFVISYAYATRRAESIIAAKNILINSLPKFPREAIMYYNLACYDCQLGQIDSAKQYLKQAFRIDSNWRLEALGDDDLKPLWDCLEGLHKGH